MATKAEPQKSLRATILEVDDLQIEVITVPEWGDIKIEVRGMDGRSRARFMNKVSGGSGEVNFDHWYPELIIATAYDPDAGTKVFEAADRDALNKKSGAALSRLGDLASRLSGLGATDVDKAEERLKSE
jgi:hypothetical protein